MTGVPEPRPGISFFQRMFFVSLHSSGGFAGGETPVHSGRATAAIAVRSGRRQRQCRRRRRARARGRSTYGHVARIVLRAFLRHAGFLRFASAARGAGAGRATRPGGAATVRSRSRRGTFRQPTRRRPRARRSARRAPRYARSASSRALSARGSSPAYGSHRTSAPVAPSSVSVDRAKLFQWLRSEIEKATGPPGRGGSADDHRAPRRNLLLGARDERRERGASRSHLSCAARVPTACSPRPVRSVGLARRTAHAAAARPPLSARSAAASGGGRRTRAAGQRVDEIARPRVGDDHAGRRQDDEHRRAPESDHVVPVEVAGLAAQSAAEEHHRAHVPPRPLPRPPQIETRDREHEERRVARAGDRARRRAVLTLGRRYRCQLVTVR